MGFTKPTIDQLTALATRSLQNANPNLDVTVGGDNWTRCRVLAGVAASILDKLQTVERDASPLTAKGEKLDEWMGIFGLERQGETQASGASAGRIRGTNGSTWETTDALEHTNGNVYYPTASGTLDASGTFDVGLISEDSGSEMLLEEGEVLTWVSTPTGLEDQVRLVAAIDEGGEDQESDGSGRTRLNIRTAEPSMGGNAQDYVDWLIESDDDIKFGYVWPNRNGAGSVDVAALKDGEGDARLLDATERRPAGVRDIRMLEVTTETANVELSLLPSTGDEFARDWDDSTPLVVDSWTALTRTLVFTTDRPATMAVGSRIVIEDTSGEEQVIESLSSTDAVVLTDPTVTPVATKAVYSGGPLIEPVREAIKAHINSMGPEVGDYGTGRWEGTLRLNNIRIAAGEVEGVADTTLIEPVANVEPTTTVYPDDDTVNLIIPGNIVVYYE
jgi:uncharacterized phage protein gp47/JayE